MIGKSTWTIILFKREQDLKDTQTQFGQNQGKLDPDRDGAKQQNFPELFMFSPIMITTHIRAAQIHFAVDTQTWRTNYSDCLPQVLIPHCKNTPWFSMSIIK